MAEAVPGAVPTVVNSAEQALRLLQAGAISFSKAMELIAAYFETIDLRLADGRKDPSASANLFMLQQIKAGQLPGYKLRSDQNTGQLIPTLVDDPRAPIESGSSAYVGPHIRPADDPSAPVDDPPYPPYINPWEKPVDTNQIQGPFLAAPDTVNIFGQPVSPLAEASQTAEGRARLFQGQIASSMPAGLAPELTGIAERRFSPFSTAYELQRGMGDIGRDVTFLDWLGAQQGTPSGSQFREWGQRAGEMLGSPRPTENMPGTLEPNPAFGFWTHYRDPQYGRERQGNLYQSTVLPGVLPEYQRSAALELQRMWNQRFVTTPLENPYTAATGGR